MGVDVTRYDLEEAIKLITWRARIEVAIGQVVVYVPARRVAEISRVMAARFPLTVNYSVRELVNPLSMKKRTYLFEGGV